MTLALGASTAVFSVLNGVALKPLPYPDQTQLVGICHAAPGIDIFAVVYTAIDKFLLEPPLRNDQRKSHA